MATWAFKTCLLDFPSAHALSIPNIMAKSYHILAQSELTGNLELRFGRGNLKIDSSTAPTPPPQTSRRDFRVSGAKLAAAIDNAGEQLSQSRPCKLRCGAVIMGVPKRTYKKEETEIQCEKYWTAEGLIVCTS